MVPGELGIDDLTARQREVLALLAKGLTNDEIGGTLGISLPTVRTHVTAILARLDVTNRTEAAWKYHAWEARCDADAVLAQPAIAVLPLTALDDGPRARTVAGGISCDLVALFAGSCWFPVIGTTSTSRARELGPTTQHLARALGARFVVDGSLRMHGGTWRLQVSIDDAELGHCIWIARHEFPDSALFEVQDDLCAAIVAAAYPVLVRRVQLGLRRVPRPGDPATWELTHQAMELCARREQRAVEEAGARFEALLTREPTLVLGHYGQGLCAYDRVLNQWGPDERAREQLLAAATACVELAPHAGEGYFLHARHALTRGDFDGATRMLERAVGRNPSFAHAHALLAQTLQILGRTDESLKPMAVARRLSPRAFVAGLGLLHFMRGEYRDALAASEQAVAFNPRYPFARAVAAASAQMLDERARAGEHARLLHAEHPTFSPARLLRVFGPDAESLRRLSGALQALGVRS